MQSNIDIKRTSYMSMSITTTAAAGLVEFEAAQDRHGERSAGGLMRLSLKNVPILTLPFHAFHRTRARFPPTLICLLYIMKSICIVRDYHYSWAMLIVRNRCSEIYSPTPNSAPSYC